jgi:hypothetical protein
MTLHEMLLLVFFPLFYLSLFCFPLFIGSTFNLVNGSESLVATILDTYQFTIAPDMLWFHVAISTTTAMLLTIPRLMINKRLQEKDLLPESEEIFFQKQKTIEDNFQAEWRASA